MPKTFFKLTFIMSLLLRICYDSQFHVCETLYANELYREVSLKSILFSSHW